MKAERAIISPIITTTPKPSKVTQVMHWSRFPKEAIFYLTKRTIFPGFGSWLWRWEFLPSSFYDLEIQECWWCIFSLVQRADNQEDNNLNTSQRLEKMSWDVPTQAHYYNGNKKVNFYFLYLSFCSEFQWIERCPWTWERSISLTGPIHDANAIWKHPSKTHRNKIYIGTLWQVKVTDDTTINHSRVEEV